MEGRVGPWKKIYVSSLWGGGGLFVHVGIFLPVSATFSLSAWGGGGFLGLSPPPLPTKISSGAHAVV